ncbi:MAG TPA: nitroreductase family deazaflavin-dependent oxidoreductase [Acidimicrobiia bacterium]|jgi:deazaflavin-dependent oxidoreductase (nitroreductase family)
MSPGLNLPSTNQLKDGLSRVFMAAHTQLFRRTGGRIGGKLGRAEMMLLTTTGRRSGQPRTTPLTCIRDGERFLAIASFGGDDRDPQWFKNLQANPDATIQVAGETVAVRASVATAEEKKALWPKAVAAYKGYDGYQRKTSRDIPVVILSRTGISST